MRTLVGVDAEEHYCEALALLARLRFARNEVTLAHVREPVLSPLYAAPELIHEGDARVEAFLRQASQRLLQEALSEAEVASQMGSTKIETRLEKMSPPSQFGPEYMTYVLWAITPEGRVACREYVSDNHTEVLNEFSSSAASSAFTLEPPSWRYTSMLEEPGAAAVVELAVVRVNPDCMVVGLRAAQLIIVDVLCV